MNYIKLYLTPSFELAPVNFAFLTFRLIYLSLCCKNYHWFGTSQKSFCGRQTLVDYCHNTEHMQQILFIAKRH